MASMQSTGILLRKFASCAARNSLMSIKTTRTHCYSKHSKLTLKEILSQYADIELMPFRVETMTRFGQTFSNARLQTYPYCVDRNKSVIDPYETQLNGLAQSSAHDQSVMYCLDFKHLFRKGMREVEQIVSELELKSDKSQNISMGSHKTDDYQFPTSGKKARLFKTVKTLQKFLYNIEHHQRCLSELVENSRDTWTELEPTILLANHLFSPLVSYDDSGGGHCKVITDDSKSKWLNCPCVEKCDANIVYSNAEFGSQYLYYGKSDIMLFPVGGGAMNVIVDLQKPNMDKEIKSNADHLRCDKYTDKVISQAITFSLYQKKFQKRKQIYMEEVKVNNDMESTVATTLIPTIVTSAHYFDVYLYDSENDVLLRNLDEPIPIFEKNNMRKFGQFNLNAVLQIWMLINHLLLEPELAAYQLDILKETCGVRKHITSIRMKKIEETLMVATRFKPPNTRIQSQSFNWNKI